MASFVFFSPDLARNPVYVPWQFKGALEVNHTVSIVGPCRGRLWEPLRSQLKPIRVLPGANPLSAAVLRVAMDATEGVDLLYAFKALPESLGVAYRVARRRKLPLALHLCDWDAGFFADRSWLRRTWYGIRGIGHPTGPLALWGAEKLVGSADVLTVSTRGLQRRFGGTLVPQGVDTHSLSPERYPREEARARIGVGGDNLLLLFLGTPRAHKGLAELARAVRGLRNPRVRAVVVGAEGAGEGEKGRGALEGLELRGPVPVEEAPWWLRASDVFLVPQRPTPFAEHQLPAKLLLAMALGATILATAVGDAVEILGGDTPAGCVVPPDDPDALVTALAGLLADPGLRATLGGEARRRAQERYGWSAMRRDLNPLLDPFLPL